MNKMLFDEEGSTVLGIETKFRDVKPLERKLKLGEEYLKLKKKLVKRGIRLRRRKYLYSPTS
jgi:hypothetical protein